MILLERWNLSRDEVFKKRLAAGATLTAIQVASEAPTTQDHVVRLKLANLVLGQGPLERLLLAVAVTVPQDNEGSVSDQDILTALASIWTAEALSLGP